MSKLGNPAMRTWSRRSANGQMAVERASATYKGVIWKSAFLILLTIAVAIATDVVLWTSLNNVMSGELSTDEFSRALTVGFVVAAVAGVVMLVGFFVMLFNVGAAKVFAPIYAVCQGAFLGAMASLLNLLIPGVSLAALLGTGVVFAVCIVMYKLLGARISGTFARCFTIAVLSFLLVELICVPILYFFAANSGNLALILGVQAAIAFFCVVFGAIAVFSDIQNIDVMVQVGADQKYEWALAFSLTTSLVYLYLEILELLVRFFALFRLTQNR